MELSGQLLNPDNQLGVKVEWLKEAPQLQLLPILLAIQNGDWTEAGQLWRRLPGRFILVSRAIYDYRKQAGGEKKPLLVRFGTREELCLPVGVFDYDAKTPMAALGQNIIGMELGQAARFIRPGPTPGGWRYRDGASLGYRLAVAGESLRCVSRSVRECDRDSAKVAEDGPRSGGSSYPRDARAEHSGDHRRAASRLLALLRWGDGRWTILGLQRSLSHSG
jgi:hypothetical protein